MTPAVGGPDRMLTLLEPATERRLVHADRGDGVHVARFIALELDERVWYNFTGMVPPPHSDMFLRRRKLGLTEGEKAQLFHPFNN